MPNRKKVLRKQVISLSSKLLTYLESRPVSEWFNPNAPALKKKHLDPNAFTKEEALSLLFDDPILIRRPLLSVQGKRMCGFDKNVIEDILEISLDRDIDDKCSSKIACPAPVSSSTSK